MARFTETGAFTGARARPLRKSAALPGVVGPDEGKELARLIDAAAINTTAPISNSRTAILTVTSIQLVVCPRGLFQKSSRQTSTIFWRNASRSGDLQIAVCLGRRFVTRRSLKGWGNPGRAR